MTESAHHNSTPGIFDGRMKIRHLILVDALTRQGTVVAAAELHTTQPATSRQLKELEELLGVPLYRRHPQGIEPTVFGRSFSEQARAVLSQLRQAEKHLKELRTAHRGQVVIGSNLAGSNTLLPRAIAALKAERPELTVIIEEGSPGSLQEKLDAGQIDFILGRLTQPSDERFRREPLYQDSVQLFVRPGRPLIDMISPDAQALGRYPWVLPHSGTDLRSEIDEFLSRNAVILPDNQVQTTSFLTIRQLVRRNDSIAALPQSVAQDDPLLVPLPFQLDTVAHQIGVPTFRNRTLDPAARHMLGQLRASGD